MRGPRLRYSQFWSTDRRTRSSQLFWFALLCLQTVLIGVGYVLIHSALQISQQAASNAGSITAGGVGWAATAGTAQQTLVSPGGSNAGCNEERAPESREGQSGAADGAGIATAGQGRVRGNDSRQHASRHTAGQSPHDSLSNHRRSTRLTQQHASHAGTGLAAETTDHAAETDSSAPEAADAGAGAGELVAGATSAAAAVESYLASIRPSWTQHWHEAVARQARPSAADAGLLYGMVAVDGSREALQQRILHVNALMNEAQAVAPCLIAISTVWTGDQASLRSRLLPWLAYHAALGVGTAYLLLEDSDEAQLAVLRTLKHVRLVHASEVAGEVKRRELSSDAGMSHVLAQAQQEGLRWLVHMEPHSLIHPGHPSFSLAAELCSTAASVPAVSFRHLEAVPEAGDITDPLQQVTLFRAPARTPQQTLWARLLHDGHSTTASLQVSHSHSAVRLDAPGLRITAQGVTGDTSPRWVAPSNPAGTWVPQPAREGSYMLHYRYCRMEDAAAARELMLHCSQGTAESSQVQQCAGMPMPPAAMTSADVSKCSSCKALEDWFYAQFVLSEGAPVACGRAPDTEMGPEGWCSLSGVEVLKEQLLQAGVLLRLHAPQQLHRGLERLLQQRLLRHKGAGAASVQELLLRE